MRTSFGIFTVATNIYVDYWQAMVRSADANFMPGHPKTFYVFTDSPTVAASTSQDLIESRVVAYEVPSYRWPEATLFRYRLAAARASEMEDDALLHLDADMLVVKPVDDLEPQRWIDGLAFVQHPGFRRPRRFRLAQYYLRNPLAFRRDLLLHRAMGGLGAWETRPESSAFTPRERRHAYVYGAIWLGRREALLDMCRELSDAVDRDLAEGRIADWHDESHLNRYASEHAHSLLDSDLCYVPGWSNLGDLHPRIQAVQKGVNQTR